MSLGGPRRLAQRLRRSMAFKVLATALVLFVYFGSFYLLEYALGGWPAALTPNPPVLRQYPGYTY